MTDHQPKHVFISYVRENQDQVDRLYEDLESHGVNVWLDRHSIKPGARWKSAIQEAIRNGNFLIACFSDEYNSKGKTHMNEELVLATEELRQYPPDREWFIPVLLAECDVPARSIGAGETLLDINWVSLYEDWDAGIQSILSVIKPTPPEIQNLIAALHSKSPAVRDKTVDALGNIGSEAVPALIEALNEEDKNVRRSATEALLEMGPEAKAAVPALMEAFNYKDWRVTGAAFRALTEIGLKAVPALIKALKDEDENKNVRIASANVLGKIGPDTKAAVPALIKALKDEDEILRFFTTQALGKIGPEANAAVPALIEALKDENELVCEWAADALKKINTPEAQKALEEYNKQKSD